MTPKCGGCGSERLENTQDTDTPYSMCLACGRLQETETRVDPNRQLCDNCACRPNSVERQDPYGWMRWEELHLEMGVPFYCHKGMGAELVNGVLRYISPMGVTPQPCAGWLSKLAAYKAKRIDTDPDDVV